MKLFEKSKVNMKWFFFNISLKFVNKKINYVLTLHEVEDNLVTTIRYK